MLTNRLICCVVVLLAMLILASCGGSSAVNNGGGGDVTPGPSKLTASITAPADIEAGLSVQWGAQWNGGTAPYTVAWDFGGGTEQDAFEDSTSDLGYSLSTSMLNATATPLAYTATLTVASADGQSAEVTAAYSVGPDRSPAIESAVFDAATGVLSVVATSEVTGATLMAAVDEPDGLRADFISKSMSKTSDVTAAVSFDWTAIDILTGASGECKIVVADGLGRTSETYVDISVPALELLPDTIYAIPQKNHAKVGEVVTVVVATGVPANPFMYMVGANVTYPTWVHYVVNSENYGAIGGHFSDADGIWGEDGMGLGDGSFLTGFWNWWPYEDCDFGFEDRHRWELTVVPLGGHDITGCSGALINFDVYFDHAGTATFGFLETTPPIDRTYYRDGDNNDYFWGTLMAGPDGVLNVEGVNNTIVVTE